MGQSVDPDPASDETDNGFLDGRLRILQPRKGYRAGLDAVMVASAIPALPGQRVIEAGAGTGVASLCLLTHIAGLSVLGLEVNPDYAGLARRNAARNGFADQLQIIDGDIAMPADQRADHGLDPGSFDHGFANPPYRDEANSRAAADEGRDLAHRLTRDMLRDWAKFLIAMVRPKGTITLILPADLLEEALSLLKNRAGDLLIFPLFPKSGSPAKRILLQGVKGSRAAPKLLAGLTLHDSNGHYTQEADSILRGKCATPLAASR